MIEYIKGRVAELTPTEAIIESDGGVGYFLAISLNTFTAMQNAQREDRPGKLWVHESIREDAYDLFGFATRDERTLFRALLSVNGIGGQTARTVLSTFAPSELSQIIQTEDVNMLKTVKGVGPKAAARIVVELKDKMTSLSGEMGSSSNASQATVQRSAVVDEAVAALTMLGFAPAPSQKAVMDIVKENPEAEVQIVVKTALKALRK